MSFGGLFGGGGSPQAQTISPSAEYSKILKVFNQQALPSYNQWAGSQPLTSEATSLAQFGYGAFPALASNLASGYQQAAGATAPLPGMIQSAYQGAIPESSLASQIQSAYQAGTPETTFNPALVSSFNQFINPILQNRYSVPADLGRAQTQYSLGQAAQAGMANTNTGLANLVLGRTALEDQRYNQALQQAAGIGTQITSADAAQLQRSLAASQATEALNQGALGRAQGAAQSLYALGQAPFQQALTYGQGLQGLLGTTAGNLQAAEMGPISAYGALFNPTAQNVSNVIGYNLNAQNAANIAAANQNAALIGGTGQALGGVGSALGSYYGAGGAGANKA